MRGEETQSIVTAVLATPEPVLADVRAALSGGAK
jgi:hypothetical protein